MKEHLPSAEADNHTIHLPVSNKYLSLISAMDMGFCIIELFFDQAGTANNLRYLETNPAFERITGLHNVVGKTIYEVIPDYKDRWIDKYGEVIKTGHDVKFEVFSTHIHKAIEIHAFKIGNPGDNFVGVLFADITQRKLAEENQRLADDKYLSLFNSIDEGFCIIEMIFDSAGKPLDYLFLETNPAFEKLTGLLSAKGKTMRQFVPNHEEEWFEYYGKVAKTGQPIRFEQGAHALDSYFDLYAFKIGNADEYKVAVLFNNITERKKEEQLRQARIESEMKLKDLQLSLNEEELKRKDEFIGIASHELKTPITSIKIYTELLQEQFEKSNNLPQAALMGKLNVQVDRLTNLIKDLLDTTKISEGKLILYPEQFNVNDLIKELAEDLSRISDKHQFIVETGSLNTIMGDRERISQVVTNFVENAIKYSPQGGKITIATAGCTQGLRVSVKDEGIGIPEDVKHRVFDRFFRVSNPQMQTYPGMGLGLYISSAIIQRHGGTIGVESEEGQGAEFYFTLPYKTALN